MQQTFRDTSKLSHGHISKRMVHGEIDDEVECFRVGVKLVLKLDGFRSNEMESTSKLLLSRDVGDFVRTEIFFGHTSLRSLDDVDEHAFDRENTLLPVLLEEAEPMRSLIRHSALALMLIIG